MSVFDTVLDLGSFRSSKSRPVEREKIGKVLEAGRHAPSPGNVQSLEFIVVDEEESRVKLAEASGDRRLEEAPVSIIVIADIERMKRKVGEEAFNACNSEASAAVQSMRLVAKEAGLSSSWVTGFEDHRVNADFKIPEGKKPMGIVSLCYADSEVHPEHRFGMNEVVFYEYYDNQVGSLFDELEWEGLHENTEIASKKLKKSFSKLRAKLSDII